MSKRSPRAGRLKYVYWRPLTSSWRRVEKESVMWGSCSWGVGRQGGAAARTPEWVDYGQLGFTARGIKQEVRTLRSANFPSVASSWRKRNIARTACSGQNCGPWITPAPVAPGRFIPLPSGKPPGATPPAARPRGAATLITGPPMLSSYRQHVAERAALGIPPLPLSPEQTASLVELLESPPAGEESFRLELLAERVPAGVDDAARVKASWLAAVARGDEANALVSRARATELLGTMLGGYNVQPLVDLLDDAEVGTIAADALKHTLLVFDAFHDVKARADAGSANAAAVLRSWADAEWFPSRPEVPEAMTITVFRVPGETNPGDLSPAPEAATGPDIPMHALAMLKNQRPDAPFVPEEDGKRGPIGEILRLKEKGHLVAYVGDVVGTGSSRKSATNSVLWWTGDDIPYVPNKRAGGVCLGGKIAPIFYNTMEDAGALPIELDESKMEHGDVVELRPSEEIGRVGGDVIAELHVHGAMQLIEDRAGGRIPLIIGRGLTAKARESLGLPA